MSEQRKIVYIGTHGPEDPERATLPFVLATAALTMDVEAVVALQGNAVWLGVKGTAEHVFAGGLPPLKKLMDDFMSLEGRLLVCSPCIKHREIDPSALIESAQVVAAATLTAEILSAKAVLTY
jgi:predicted peroxiredoxin